MTHAIFLAVGVRVSGNYPENGARNPIRTDDLLITNQLLCQLSYAGLIGTGIFYGVRQDSAHPLI